MKSEQVIKATLNQMEQDLKKDQTSGFKLDNAEGWCEALSWVLFTPEETDGKST
jgi:hypothetical protein